MGAMPHDLDDAPPWAQLIYDELVRLRQAQQTQSTSRPIAATFAAYPTHSRTLT